MLNKEEMVDQTLLEVIQSISKRGESGLLSISAGFTRGAFSFSDGKLVEASLGSLTGFRAVNAAVSMTDAECSFDASIPAPRTSSLTSSERTLLKEFFGIETADFASHQSDLAEMDYCAWKSEPNWDITPTQVVPLEEVPLDSAPVEFSESVGNEVEPAAAEIPELVNEEVLPREERLEPVFSDAATPRVHASLFSRHRASLSLALLLLLTALSSFVLVHRLAQQRRQSEAPAANQSDSAAQVVEPQNEQTQPEGAVAQNLSGEWRVVNTVEQTAYRPFNNLEIGFRLVVNQNGNEFTAKGEKISENGRPLPENVRTPIVLSGSIDGDRVEATFVEEGALRKTNGRFVWTMENSGLNGRFVSSAGKTSGKSSATREL